MLFTSYVVHVSFRPFITFAPDDVDGPDTSNTGSVASAKKDAHTVKTSWTAPRASRGERLWRRSIRRMFAVFVNSRPTDISHNALESTFLICSVRRCSCRCTVYGVRCTVYGVRCTVYGVYGVRCTQPPACDRRLTVLLDNALCGCSQMCVLMAGMVFVSNGFHKGSFGFGVVTWAIVFLIVGATALFVTLVLLEVYRSIVYHKLHLAARSAEVERAERLLRAGRKLGNGRRASGNRRASIFNTVSAAAMKRLGALRHRLSIVGDVKPPAADVTDTFDDVDNAAGGDSDMKAVPYRVLLPPAPVGGGRERDGAAAIAVAAAASGGSKASAVSKAGKAGPGSRGVNGVPVTPVVRPMSPEAARLQEWRAVRVNKIRGKVVPRREGRK